MEKNKYSDTSICNDDMVDVFSNLKLVELPDEHPSSQIEHDEGTVINSNNRWEICKCDSNKSQDSCCIRNIEDDSFNKIENSLCYFNDALLESQSLLKESSSWLKSIDADIPGSNKSFNAECVRFQTILSNCSRNDQSNVNSLSTNLSPKSLIYEVDSLPDELILKIFSYFTPRELCQFVAPVCVSWHNLSKDPILWTEINSADFEDVCDDLLVDVIVGWCANLKRLELNRRSDLRFSQFRCIFESVSNLTNLSLAFCTQVSSQLLSLLCASCKVLSAIDLDGCTKITDECFYSLIGLPLKSICLSYCDQITDEGGIFIAQNFQSLVEINFDGIQWITGAFVEVLVKNHSHSLEKLFLDGENLSDYSVELLSKCKNLRVVSFSFCTNLSDKALQWIGMCTKLQHLQLRKGVFTSHSLLEYLKNMSDEQAKQFRFFNLSECSEISDECLYHIAEKFHSLEYLDLSWCCDISDDGIEFLVDSCHRLKVLKLCGLFELHGTSFSKVPIKLPDLTLLDLSQCNKIQDTLTEDVARQMRNLVIYNYYGDIVVNSKHRKAHLIT